MKIIIVDNNGKEEIIEDVQQYVLVVQSKGGGIDMRANSSAVFMSGAATALRVESEHDMQQSLARKDLIANLRVIALKNAKAEGAVN